MIWVNLLIFFASIAVLVAAGGILVRALSKIASFLHISEFVVGFIIMGIATTIPELFVGITSGIRKVTELSLGNAIGSNIANITLILGIAVILGRGIEIKSHTMKTDALYAFFIILIPVILMSIGKSISRVDGAILLLVYFFYTRWLIKARKEFKKEFSEQKVSRMQIVVQIVIFIVSLVVLFVSASFVTNYGEKLAIDFGMPTMMIGLFLLAIGTSLPELVFSVKAATSGHKTMAIGDLTGAIVSNSTLVLGVTALIHPITAHFASFVISATFMVVACFLFATFVESGNKLYPKEGVAMILLYVLFIITQFYLNSLT